MSNIDEIIAIPSGNEEGLNAPVIPRFGRCPFFTIVKMSNKEINEVTIIENPGNRAMGGAGPLAVQTISSEGVNIVIGGNYGPNAGNALAQAGIKSYGYPQGQPNLNVKALLDLYVAGELPEIQGANVGSHFGMGGGGGRGGGGGGRGMGGGGGRGMGGGGRGRM